MVTEGEQHYKAYLDWTEAWLLAERIHVPGAEICLPDVAYKVTRGLCDKELLVRVAHSLQQSAKARHITMGSVQAPSCNDTDVLSAAFDPRIRCNCSGLAATARHIPCSKARLYSEGHCHAIDKMWNSLDQVTRMTREWHGHGLFDAKTLRGAVDALVLSNTSLKPAAETCDHRTIATIKAPDRKRADQIDSPHETYSAAFPTFEQVKLCSDAKHFFSIACGISTCSEGISRAVSDAANDILIGDYAEAADEETIRLLQQTGAAAFGFLWLCRHAGDIEDWHLDILVACTLHFRVLSWYRDHARLNLPEGLYGSRMDDLISHRVIDIGIVPPIVVASLVTGRRINGDEYRELCHASVLLNDLIDIRSDASRNQRENPVLRGMSTSLCTYLGSRMRECIICVAAEVEKGGTAALVILGFCNWMLMSSHHKVYELVTGVSETVPTVSCDFGGEDEYARLITALKPFGTALDGYSPNTQVRRAELELRYQKCRQDRVTHLGWLADVARTLLHPKNLRPILDLAHYTWIGDAGDAQYCP